MGDSKPCVFCSPKTYEGRIIFENELFRVLPTIGQIPESGGYILIVPKNHVACFGAMDEPQCRELQGLSDTLEQALGSEYESSVLSFEHGIVGQTVPHAHLHLMPCATRLTDLLFDDLADCDVLTVRDFRELRGWYIQKSQPYLYWRIPHSGLRLVFRNPAVPPQYLRLITARGMGREKYGDWKKLYQDTAAAERDRFLMDDTTKRLISRLQS